MNYTIKGLPPANLRAVLPDELAESIAELERLREAAMKAKQDAVEAGHAVDRADAADRQAIADHARRKLRKAPTPTAPKLREEREQAERKAAGLAQAAADAEGELIASLDRCGAEVSERLDREADQRVIDCHEAAMRLVAMYAKRSEVRALRGWLRDPSRFAPGKFREPSEVKRRSGETMPLDEVIGLVEASLASRVAATSTTTSTEREAA